MEHVHTWGVGGPIVVTLSRPDVRVLLQSCECGATRRVELK